MIKNMTIQIHREYYGDCPYCGISIQSGSPNANISDDIETEGNIVQCPECNKTIRISEIYD